MYRPSYLIADSMITPIAEGGENNFKSVINNESGLKPYNGFGNFKEKLFAGILQNEYTFGNFSKLESLMIRCIKDSIQKSGIELNDPKSLLILATTKGNIDLLEKHKETDPGLLITELGKTIATYFKCYHKPLLISNACISGLSALIWAQRLVTSGKYDNIAVVAGDLVSEFVLSGFHSFNALSPVECKPFDENRNGINLGEAVVSVVISMNKIPERETQSEILPGYGSNDANHISGPSRNGEGLFRSITQTLGSFDGIPSFINAHGTATLYNDEMEAKAFTRASLQEIPVNSLKAYYGHTLGASALLEFVLSDYALRNNTLIGSRGYHKSGLENPLNIIKESKSVEITSFLKTSSGFGGTNASILCRKV
ncbi:MAG: beta-ketoacyl synthase [Flavobacteriales bacterium]|nr:beta-ketoacyl synthase [Flavobacteriales bacterium]